MYDLLGARLIGAHSLSHPQIPEEAGLAVPWLTWQEGRFLFIRIRSFFDRHCREHGNPAPQTPMDRSLPTRPTLLRGGGETVYWRGGGLPKAAEPARRAAFEAAVLRMSAALLPGCEIVLGFPFRILAAHLGQVAPHQDFVVIMPTAGASAGIVVDYAIMEARIDGSRVGHERQR